MRIDFEDKGNESGDGAGTEFRQTEGSKEQKYDKKEVGRIRWTERRTAHKVLKVEFDHSVIGASERFGMSETESFC